MAEEPKATEGCRVPNRYTLPPPPRNIGGIGPPLRCPGISCAPGTCPKTAPTPEPDMSIHVPMAIRDTNGVLLLASRVVPCQWHGSADFTGLLRLGV